MAGRELALRKLPVSYNLQEESAKAKLREVWSNGDVYVELREVGKKFIFFCTLCLAQCFNDSSLDDHLRGNLHSKRRVFAQSTLFGEILWPFNDGVLFFSNNMMKEKEQECPRIAYDIDAISGHEVSSELTSHGQGVSNSSDVSLALVLNDHDKNPVSVEMDTDNSHHAIVKRKESHVMSFRTNGNSSAVASGNANGLVCNVTESYQFIHGVLMGQRVSDLPISLMGLGCISSRFIECEQVGKKFGRVWCAWLGEGDSENNELLSTMDCDFAIVSFSYRRELGRKCTSDDLDLLVSSASFLEFEVDNTTKKKKKKSFSDTEVTTGSFSEHGDSSSEGGPDSSGFTVQSTMSKDDQFNDQRLMSTKAVRRDLRRRKRMDAEKSCDICRQPMLPGKDAAALLNLKTGKLACSSRNTNGAFHAFHVSCLIHWILVCELELWNSTPTKVKKPRGRKGKVTLRQQISSILCPECQGTGANIKGDQLENPTVPHSEIFRCKLKAIQTNQAWKENPEILQKSCTGLRFSCQGSLQEKPLPDKLLHFYRAHS